MRVKSGDYPSVDNRYAKKFRETRSFFFENRSEFSNPRVRGTDIFSEEMLNDRKVLRDSRNSNLQGVLAEKSCRM